MPNTFVSAAKPAPHAPISCEHVDNVSSAVAAQGADSTAEIQPMTARAISAISSSDSHFFESHTVITRQTGNDNATETWALLGDLSRLAKRFWRLVAVSDDAGACWPWLGCKNKRTGHGHITVGSRKTRRAIFQTHRLAWILAHGQIPGGLIVRHAVCGNAACCRPDHLALGTQADNCQDTVRMGRTLTGERNHNAKLTEADVLDVLARQEAGQSMVSIAAAKRVDPSLIWQICHGRGWRHIPRPATPAKGRAA